MKPMFFVVLALFLGAQAHAADAIAKAQIGKPLTCGYVVYAPALMQDQKTKAWSGFDKDFADLVVQRMESTYERTAETNWGVVVEDLRSNKYDFLCTTYWVNPHKAKFALFSDPLYYQPSFPVARIDDKRFDGHPERLNDPKIKIAVLEGDNSVNIAKVDFPKAELVTLSSMQKYSDTALWVASGKADVALFDAAAFDLYNKNNPGKLKLINTDKPLRVYPAGFVFKGSDVQLWHAFNMAIQELRLDGSLERVMRKYITAPHAYYPVGRDGKYIVVDKVKR
jgi:ABC-type amino acid transport substrate-binding protein